MTQGHHGGSSARRRRATVRPRLLPLEDRALPSITNPLDPSEIPAPPPTTTPPPAVVTSVVAVGADVGNRPFVRVLDTASGQTKFTIAAYESTFRGGVRVATGDITGDGIPDIVTAPGVGGGPLVKVWDGASGSMLTAFMAYDQNFRGGMYVAVADVNGDGYGDIITGAGEGGGPHVRVFNGTWAVPPFHDGSTGPPTASAEQTGTTTEGSGTTSTGETTTTTGDGSGATTTGDGGSATGEGATTTTGDGSGTTTTGDGSGTTGGDTVPLPEPVVTPAPVEPPTDVLTEFMAYDERFRGGVRVAAGDVTGDGKADVITGAGIGGGPHVRIYDSTTGQVYREFMAFSSVFTGGVYVTAGDIDGDGRAEVAVSSGPSGGGRVNLYSGESGTQLRSYSVSGPISTAAVRVHLVDYDNDGHLDLLTATGQELQIRDPRTNALKTAFTPLEPSFLGGVNFG